MSILRVFTTLSVTFNFVLVALGAFGYIWRPIFRTGARTAPYWLVRLYSWLTPRGTAILLGVWLVFTLLAFVVGAFSSDRGKGFAPLNGTLRLGLILAVIASIPSFFVRHSHIMSETFNSGTYNLVNESTLWQDSVMVVHCSDIGQFSCRSLGASPVGFSLDPTPTPGPIPTKIVVVEGVEVILRPNIYPTATPMIAFGYEAEKGDLGVRIGQDWHLLETVAPTPTLLPNQTPEATPAP